MDARDTMYPRRPRKRNETRLGIVDETRPKNFLYSIVPYAEAGETVPFVQLTKRLSTGREIFFSDMHKLRERNRQRRKSRDRRTNRLNGRVKYSGFLPLKRKK